MNKFMLCALVASLAGAAASASADPRRRDQDEAYSATRSGQVRPLREIEARILPRMQGTSYIGPEYDSDLARYRLKFMRGGSVIWVDVDARTGQVIGRSGN